jgi:hypothetical protein
MSGAAMNYYQAKSQAGANMVVMLLGAVALLTPIGLGLYVKQNLPLCKENKCDKRLVYGAMVAIVYLIVVGVMQMKRYNKEKDFHAVIREGKASAEELKKIEDEFGDFSKTTHIISAPFYIFLALVGLYIIANMAQGGMPMCMSSKWCICSKCSV